MWPVRKKDADSNTLQTVVYQLNATTAFFSFEMVRIVPFTFIQCNIAPAGGYALIWGDDRGPLLPGTSQYIQPQNIKGLFSVSVSGSVSITRLDNMIRIGQNQFYECFENTFKSRFLYFGGTVIGQYGINLSYVI